MHSKYPTLCALALCTASALANAQAKANAQPLAAAPASPSAPSAAALALTPLATASSARPPAPWRVVGVPGGKIPLTDFAMVTRDGRKVLQVTARGSYGNLVHDLPAAAPVAGLRLSWRWRLDVALQEADLRSRQGDDSPLKVCLLFDLPLERLGLIERNLLRLARAATAEKLPSATLCYVWDDRLSPETLLPNAYTDRVRLIVATSRSTAAPGGCRTDGADCEHRPQRGQFAPDVQTHRPAMDPPAGATWAAAVDAQPMPHRSDGLLGQWVAHTRDVAADFRRAFGTESERLPPIMAVLIGGDADNTGGDSLGYVDDVSFMP